MPEKINDRKLVDSTVEKETRTLADFYDMQRRAVSSFDLPVNDYRDTVADIMINQVGVKVKIDGQTEHIMLSDLDKVYTNIQGNMKDVSYLYGSSVKRGSRIDFDSGAIGLVWSIPDDDIVSESSKALILNNQIEFFRISSGYDEDPDSPTYGDAQESVLLDLKTVDAFVERVDGQIRSHDVGILYDTVVRAYTFQKDVIADPELRVGDVAKVLGKYFDVNDVDNLTSGITKVQLKNSRTVYDDWIIKPFIDNA